MKDIIDIMREGAEKLVPHPSVLPLVALIVLLYWTTGIGLRTVELALFVTWFIGIITRQIAEGED